MQFLAVGGPRLGVRDLVPESAPTSMTQINMGAARQRKLPPPPVFW